MSKIMAIIGVFFISLIVGFIFTSIDLFFGGDFLYNFFMNQILSITITLISFNIASVTFMISNLSNIEEKYNKEIFSSTRSELKDNVMLMLGLFVIIFLLLLLLDNIKALSGITYFVYKGIILSLFFVEIYAVIEIFGLIIKYKSINLKN